MLHSSPAAGLTRALSVVKFRTLGNMVYLSSPTVQRRYEDKKFARLFELFLAIWAFLSRLGFNIFYDSLIL